MSFIQSGSKNRSPLFYAYRDTLFVSTSMGQSIPMTDAVNVQLTGGDIFIEGKALVLADSRTASSVGTYRGEILVMNNQGAVSKGRNVPSNASFKVNMDDAAWGLLSDINTAIKVRGRSEDKHTSDQYESRIIGLSVK